MGPSQISDTPFQGYVIIFLFISLISTLAIPKYHILFMKFTPPHKCHTTTVLYVYFGSRVKQLSVLFAVHIF